MVTRPILILLCTLYLAPSSGQSNRVHFPGLQPDRGGSNRTHFSGSSRQPAPAGGATAALPAELPEKREKEQKAATADHQAIQNILKAYASKDQLKLRHAFREHIPTLSDFEALFLEERFEGFYDEYFRLYKEEFPKFLNKVSELDLERTNVYYIALEDFASSEYRKAFRKPIPKMMRADLFLKRDKLGIISDSPFIHLFFIRLESGLRIFHFQALENSKPRP